MIHLFQGFIESINGESNDGSHGVVVMHCGQDYIRWKIYHGYI